MSTNVRRGKDNGILALMHVHTKVTSVEASPRFLLRHALFSSLTEMKIHAMSHYQLVFIGSKMELPTIKYLLCYTICIACSIIYVLGNFVEHAM